MTDTHTHILPRMDDGAKSVDMSLTMLRMEGEQGVDTVVLTPHFYRRQESPEEFIARRRRAADELAKALDALPEEERRTLPRTCLGAEVAWVPNLQELPRLEELCLGGSKYILVELPMGPWDRSMVDQLYSFTGRTGLTMVLAHMERYLKSQRPELLDDVLALGAPVQVSAGPLLRTLTRGPALRLLGEGKGRLLISDCHDLTTRPPNLGPGMKTVARKLGDRTAGAVIRSMDGILPSPPG